MANGIDAVPSVLEHYLRCFNSYAAGWKVPYLSPRQMAIAGLAYTGVSDRVKCFYCSIELDSWKPKDDPHFEHLNKSPRCAFFRNYNNERGYDECGIYNNMPDFDQNGGNGRNLIHFFHIIGIMHYVGICSVKEFSIYEDRLNTFDKCLLKMKKDFRAYVDAGFYYIGKGNDDHMACFFCNQSLSSWEDDDDPWVEHARWSSNCMFVLLNKGLTFIQMVCGTEGERVPLKQKDLLAMIDYHTTFNSNTGVSIMKPNMERNVDEEKDKDITEIFAKTELNVTIKKQDPDAVQDSFLCKICFRNEIMIAFIPCCHVMACVDCALTMGQCAICRVPYTSVLKVFISSDKVEDKAEDKLEELQDVACGESSQALDKSPSDNMLCKICRIDEMQIVFLPCRHIYSCINCASDLHDCPVCSEVICASVQIFL